MGGALARVSVACCSAQQAVRPQGVPSAEMMQQPGSSLRRYREVKRRCRVSADGNGEGVLVLEVRGGG